MNSFGIIIYDATIQTSHSLFQIGFTIFFFISFFQLNSSLFFRTYLIVMLTQFSLTFLSSFLQLFNTTQQSTNHPSTTSQHTFLSFFLFTSYSLLIFLPYTHFFNLYFSPLLSTSSSFYILIFLK